MRFHLEEEGSAKDPKTGTKVKAKAEDVAKFRKSLSSLGACVRALALLLSLLLF